MKNSIYFFLTIISAYTLLSSVQVQAESTDNLDSSGTSETIQTDDQDLDVKLSYGEQSASSKELDLVAEISSNLDSDRVIVTWELPDYIETAEEFQPLTTTTTVTKGGKQTVFLRVKAALSGSYRIKVNITAVKADVNYVTSDTMSIEFNQDKEVLPLTDEYKKAKLLLQIRNILIALTVVGVVTGIGFWLFRRYRRAVEMYK